MGQTTSKAESSIQSSSKNGYSVPHEPVASPAKCPISHETAPKQAECPVDHSAMNPLNQMPSLAQSPAPNQTVALPLERTESSIPRDSAVRWEYPSPQQFYNALVRKGWETPEEHVVTMVEIHNFLNEQAWDEVKKWERRQSGCVSSRHVHLYSLKFYSDDDIQLARFKGRPGEISPKARFWMFAGWLFPSRFK